ncbi:MAG: hypothetical protein ABI443_10530 [Chthoniobacterales bacterium]
MNVPLAFLFHLLSQIAIGGILIAFWWPIRTESRGKSIPLLVALGILSYLLGSVANPTTIHSLLQLSHMGVIPLQIVSQMNLFWSACENLFALLITLLLLSDLVNFVPEIGKNSRFYRFLSAFYSRIVPIGIVLFLLRLAPPALTYYYYITHKPF